jgi:hypothetical protein
MKPDPSIPRETELKLLLPDAASIDRLLAELGPELPALFQRNVYYDGPDGEWSAAGLAVRLRDEEGEHQLTVKSMGERQGDFVARAEYERTIEPELAWRYAPGGAMLVAAVAELMGEHGSALPDPLFAVPLVVAGSMENLRRRAHLTDFATAANAPHRLVVELDTTTYPDGSVVCEAELEVASVEGVEGAVDTLRAAFTRAGLPWTPSAVSKRERLERVLRGRKT